MRQETVSALELEWHLENHHEFYVILSESRVRRDKARLAAHYLDQANTLNGIARLDVGSRYGMDRFGNGRLESKRTLDEAKIVVNRLRDSDHRHGMVAAFEFTRNCQGTLLRAVATNRE